MKNKKSISLKLYFFTTDLPDKPLLCWSNGKVMVETNEAKGIHKTSSSVMFNSLEDIPKAVKKALSKEKIYLVGQLVGGKTCPQVDFGVSVVR